MAKEYAKKFYRSVAWRQVRAECIQRAGGLCEICYKAGEVKPGKIVHHKEHLNVDNINDPSVTLSLDNLEYVCQECHNLIHENEEINAGKNKNKNQRTKRQGRRYQIDENGNVLMPP